MKHNRRRFIRLTGAASAALAVGTFNGLSLFSSCAKKGSDIPTYGLQLYTLRDDMPKDPKAVLRQVAAAGYRQVESFDGPQGMFWGMSNTDFRKFMDDLGMSIIASHTDITSDFEKKVNEAAAIGMKYLICPWLGPQKTLDEYRQKADLFNQCGETCKKAGLRFAYHNHDYSFKQLEGIFPQDVLMENTDKDLVDFELDIYWVVTAGQDPEEWLRKHKNRYRLCHVKDRMKNATEDAATCTLGTGIINYPQVLKTAKETGMDYFIVEQERYDGTTPLKAIEANAKYMDTFRFA